jgi:chemotaxis protein MotB
MADEEKLQEEPVVIKKIIKKQMAHGHHGGAWKVAYADFVTAMMCLFLLLWLVNADPSSKVIIAKVFKQPSTSGPLQGNIFVFGGAKRPTDPGKFDGGASFLDFEKLIISKENKKEIAKMLKKELLEELELESDKELLNNVEFNLTKKGILIEIKDSATREVFKKGSSSLTEQAMQIIDSLSKLLRNKISPIILAGHTDAAQYNYGNYDNWNLSVDRAISVKNRLIFGGMLKERFARIEGYADTQPKIPGVATAAANRRITLLLLQDNEVENLKPSYINEEDALGKEIKQEKIKESQLKQDEFDVDEYLSRKKDVSRTYTLEELKKKKARDAFRKKFPNGRGSNQVGDAAQEASGGHEAKKPSGGHGGGH